MSSLRLTRDLVALGYTSNELARQTRTGQLVHVRRGAYDVPANEAASRSERRVSTHRRMIEATVRLLATDAVVSHRSAAILHFLPVMSTGLGRVQLTRPGRPGGKSRGHITTYVAPLEESEIVFLDGIVMTSMARTVVDVARSTPFDQAVMTGDAALRRGLSRSELDECLERSARRPGMAKARRVVAFLDGRSESPGESLSRVVLHEGGVPKPTLQFEVFDDQGNLMGRSDFGWEEHRTLGEFDGRVKYGRLLKPGENTEEVVFREKQREDAFRDHDWQVARWIYSDLFATGVIPGRVNRAIARHGRSR